MFNKSKQAAAEPPKSAPSAAPSSAIEPSQVAASTPKSASQQAGTPTASIISKALTVTGNLDCAGDIEIMGTIDGDVKARNVRIDEGGKVKGKIVAESAYIDGTIRGQIVAKTVALAGSANVRGDILHETLSIEAGAFLDGNCRRLKEADRATPPQAVDKRDTVKPVVGTAAAQAS